MEIEAPAVADLRDVPQRMADLFATLEISEGASRSEILEDLQTPAADIVRVRVAGPESRDGSLPFEDAVDLIDHARDLLLEAACSTIRPRAFFEAPKPSQATEFLRHLRMGQTERGSFVVTIQCRVPPALDQHVRPRPAESGTVTGGGVVDGRPRKVTVTLVPDDHRRACDAQRDGFTIAASAGW